MFEIVKARIEDAEDYANILNKSWKDTYGDYISIEHIDDEFNIDKLINEFNDYINNNDFEIYMLSLDGKNIGILEFGKYEDKYKDNMDGVCEIRTLHIKKEYTHKGFGSKALKYAINELSKKGYNTVCLWVKKQNHNAIKAYEKIGFVKTGYGLEETIDGAPSMVMEKQINNN